MRSLRHSCGCSPSEHDDPRARGPPLGGRGDATLDVLRLLSPAARDCLRSSSGTFRGDEFERSQLLRIVLGEVGRAERAVRLELEALSATAVAELARPYGIDPIQLHERTSGNPFLRRRGARGGRWPESRSSVRDAVLARTAPPPARKPSWRRLPSFPRRQSSGSSISGFRRSGAGVADAGVGDCRRGCRSRPLPSRLAQASGGGVTSPEPPPRLPPQSARRPRLGSRGVATWRALPTTPMPRGQRRLSCVWPPPRGRARGRVGRASRGGRPVRSGASSRRPSDARRRGDLLRRRRSRACSPTITTTRSRQRAQAIDECRGSAIGSGKAIGCRIRSDVGVVPRVHRGGACRDAGDSDLAPRGAAAKP